MLRTLARPDALICPACERQLVRARGAVCGKCGKLLDAKNTAATAGQTDASGAWKPAWQAANALSEGTKPAVGMKPAARGMQAVRLCGDCATIRHAFSRGGAAFTWHSAHDAIYRFKYKGRREYADFFFFFIAGVLRERFAGETFDLLVPVPLSAERMRSRGYNQALLLAEGVGAASGIPVGRDALRRVKATLPMKDLSPESRRRNMKNAFHAYRNDVKSKKIMLVDDIYTTGATIDACAEAILAAGAVKVCFLTAAIGEEPAEGRLDQ